MITGDNPPATDQIARQLGIGRVYSQVLPQDKLRLLRELQAEGNKVAFASDGVNDTPALANSTCIIQYGQSKGRKPKMDDPDEKQSSYRYSRSIHLWQKSYTLL